MAIHTPTATQVGITIIGGNDAPGIQLVPDGHGGWIVKKVPGWNPDLMVDLAHSLRVIDVASRLKTPGLSEAALKSVGEFVQAQLKEHVAAGNVLVIRA